MNYVYLSPHFPPNYYLFAVHLSRLGVTVLGLADEPYEQLRPELRGALAEYYRVGDMHHYDELLRGCGYFTHRYGRLNGLESHSEYWMETDARLRTDFNIPGPRLNDIAAYKRKSLMKAAFERSGVPAARGRLIYAAEDARALIAETGYPVVAKPDIGVGASNTFCIENDAGLERFFATRPPVDYIMEEFVRGQIVTFDGLADQDGQPVFFGSLVYNQGLMEVVNEDGDIFAYAERDVPPDLEEAGRRLLKEFDVRARFFHFEFFRLADGGLVALEVNIRPPGGIALDIHNYSADVDLYWGWANVVVNNKFAPYTRTRYCCFVSRKRHKPYRHTHDEVLAAWGRLIATHEPLPEAFSQAMGHYAYMIRSADKEEMLAAARFIQELAP